MKDFIQTNFAELLLLVILLALMICLLFFIHWHDNTASTWAMNTIGAVIVAMTTLINSLKRPLPNGSVTETVSTTPPPEKKP
jgi:hypothetical protein